MVEGLRLSNESRKAKKPCPGKDFAVANQVHNIEVHENSFSLLLGMNVEEPALQMRDSLQCGRVSGQVGGKVLDGKTHVEGGLRANAWVSDLKTGDFGGHQKSKTREGLGMARWNDIHNSKRNMNDNDAAQDVEVLDNDVAQDVEVPAIFGQVSTVTRIGKFLVASFADLTSTIRQVVKEIGNSEVVSNVKVSRTNAHPKALEVGHGIIYY